MVISVKKLGLIIFLFIFTGVVKSCVTKSLPLKDELGTDQIIKASQEKPFNLGGLPNDPMLPKQFGIFKTQAHLTWNVEVSSSPVIVAVIDTGIDWTHPDLNGVLWINDGEDLNHNGSVEHSDFNGIDDDKNGYIDDIIGWDFFSNDNDPMDSHGHGTSVSGIISASTNNGIGIAGTILNCKIMPVRVRKTMKTDYKLVAKGIKYAVNNGAKVINLSLGGQRISPNYLKKTIEWAYSKEVLIVGSAGNQNSTKNHYPDAYPEVISVAALDQNDVKSSNSNYGKNVEVCAPTGSYTAKKDGKYGRGWGTSHATPYVSALGALLFSKYPKWANEQVRKRIIDSADSIETFNPKYKGKLGAGRVNFHKALCFETVNDGK